MLDITATEKTKEATKDKSFYSRNQNKREARGADSKVWGAIGAMSNVSTESVNTSEVQKSVEENIVKFPTTNEMRETNQPSISDIQALFSRKSQERRRRNETNE